MNKTETKPTPNYFGYALQADWCDPAHEGRCTHIEVQVPMNRGHQIFTIDTNTARYLRERIDALLSQVEGQK